MFLFKLQGEENYERWQLLKEPVSLESFLIQPLLTGLFFDYSLRLEPELTHPIIVHEKKTTINIWAWEPVRYRYKFFPANRVRGLKFYPISMKGYFYIKTDNMINIFWFSGSF